MSLDLWGLSPVMQLLLGGVLFVTLGVVASVLEWKHPARSTKGNWPKVYLGKDALILIGVFAAGALLQAAQKWLESQVTSDSPLAEVTWASSLWAIFLVFGVLDFTMYWIHRAIHSPILWPIHRWHHSIRELNWLSGVRSSFTELVFYSVPSFVLYLLAPQTLAWSILYFFYSQIFIHLNLKMGFTDLGKWIVLPQYHRVHHGLDPRFHNRCFGNFWVIWDRVFGTYADPRLENDDFPLGIEREAPLWKMASGI